MLGALRISLVALAAIVTPTLAAAQSYPNRPIRLFVGYPPGGAADIIARLIGQGMSVRLGQPIVIDNKPGSGTNMAGDAAAKSAPDGYTLLHASDNLFAVNPHLYARMPFDPLKDLVPVATLISNQYVLAVHPSVPANTLREFVEHAGKTKPPLFYASIGNGSSHHLAMEMLKQQANIDLVHVPYRGAGPAIVDILAGQIPMIVPAMTAIVQQHHEAGRLRILAVTHATRLKAAPDLPTAIEQGFPDVVAPNFIGLYFPTDTPKEIVDHVAQANLKLMAEPSWQEFLVKGAFEIEPPLSTEKYKQYVEDEMRRWRPIVSAMGIKID